MWVAIARHKLSSWWQFKAARFEKCWPPFCQIWIIFTHLKLWIASARHNFKWVKILIEKFGGWRVIYFIMANYVAYIVIQVHNYDTHTLPIRLRMCWNDARADVTVWCKLSNLVFHPRIAEDRVSEPQLDVGDIYSDMAKHLNYLTH